MKIFSNKRFLFRALALALIAVMLLPALISCQIGVSQNEKEVGTVGKYSVPYEEFYFLANNHYNAIKDNYKNDPERLEKAVWNYVGENIIANYAILSLCEDEGIVYDESELSDQVDSYIDSVIASDYAGDEDAYYESLEAMGLTDHYARFVAGVDILYSRLADEYKKSGLIPNTDEKTVDYVKENFIHTCHITIFVNPGESKEAKRAKAEEALKKLESGKYDSVVNMLGKTDNEVLYMSSAPYDGEYFARGMLDKAFENAAFSLDIGEHSSVIEGVSKNMNDQYVECFYIIERMNISEAEIESDLENLSDDVTAAIINEKIETVRSKLTFSANDYAKGLDLGNLEPVEYSSWSGTIILLIVGVVLCAAMVAVVIIVRRVRKKRFRAMLTESKSRNKR